MPPNPRRRARAHALAASLALVLFAGAAAPVDAADGLFEALFGRAAPQVQPAPAPDASYRPRSRRVTRHRLRARYAALPRSEPLKVRISDRQKPIDLKDGVMAAMMRDETLRPGDIVVLRTGARVFTGAPDKTHRASEFEPVQHSRRVDPKTRRLLAAMMTPAGALPADEARRLVARVRRAAPSEPAVATAGTAVQAMRVINPWKLP